MKVLIVGVGISNVHNDNYGQLDLIANYPLRKELEKKYDKIVYFKYQQYLDKGALIGHKILDPIRWKFRFIQRKKILTNFEFVVKSYQAEGFEVDLLAHSLFCWISSNAKVHLNKAIHCGSPVGFVTPFARFLVRNDIATFGWSRPPMRCDEFINLYSTHFGEPVGHRPNIPDNPKWAYGALNRAEFNTYQNHDFKNYLRHIYNYNLY